MGFIGDNVSKIHTLRGRDVIPAREAVAWQLRIRSTKYMRIEKSPPKWAI